MQETFVLKRDFNIRTYFYITYVTLKLIRFNIFNSNQNFIEVKSYKIKVKDSLFL